MRILGLRRGLRGVGGAAAQTLGAAVLTAGLVPAGVCDAQTVAPRVIPPSAVLIAPSPAVAPSLAAPRLEPSAVRPAVSRGVAAFLLPAAPDIAPAAAPRVGAAAPRVGAAALRVGAAAPRVGDVAPRVGDVAPRVGDVAPAATDASPSSLAGRHPSAGPRSLKSRAARLAASARRSAAALGLPDPVSVPSPEEGARRRVELLRSFHGDDGAFHEARTGMYVFAGPGRITWVPDGPASVAVAFNLTLDPSHREILRRQVGDRRFAEIMEAVDPEAAASSSAAARGRDEATR